MAPRLVRPDSPAILTRLQFAGAIAAWLQHFHAALSSSAAARRCRLATVRSSCRPDDHRKELITLSMNEVVFYIPAWFDCTGWTLRNSRCGKLSFYNSCMISGEMMHLPGIPEKRGSTFAGGIFRDTGELPLHSMQSRSRTQFGPMQAFTEQRASRCYSQDLNIFEFMTFPSLGRLYLQLDKLRVTSSMICSMSEQWARRIGLSIEGQTSYPTLNVQIAIHECRVLDA